MSSSASGDVGVFSGDAGKTRTHVHTIWCAECGAWYGAEVWATINAATDPLPARRLLEGGVAAVNTVTCPACSAKHMVPSSLVFHDPEARCVALVVSSPERHRAQQLWAELVGRVSSPAGHLLPPYARVPALVVGAEGLRACLSGEAPRSMVSLGAAPQAMGRPRPVVSPPAILSAPPPSAPAKPVVEAPSEGSTHEGGELDDSLQATAGIIDAPEEEPEGSSALEEALSGAPAVLDFSSVDGDGPDEAPEPAPARGQGEALDAEPTTAWVKDLAGGEAASPTASGEVSDEQPPEGEGLASEDAEGEGADKEIAGEGSADKGSAGEESAEEEGAEEEGADEEGPVSDDALEAAEGSPEEAAEVSIEFPDEGPIGLTSGDDEPSLMVPLPSVDDDDDITDMHGRARRVELAPVAPPTTPAPGATQVTPVPVEDPEEHTDTVASPAVVAEPPPDAGEAEEALSVELSIAEEDEAEQSDNTHVVPSQEISGSRRAPRRLFQEELAFGTDRYLAVDEDRVVAAIRMDSTTAESYELEPSQLLFQTHQLAVGPVMSLSLVQVVDGEWLEPLVWILHHETPEHAEVLNRLRNRFEVEVLFYGQDDVLIGHRRFTLPLERNVAQGWSRVMEAEAALGRRLDRNHARAEVASPNFERFGRLRHNFHEHSFSDLITASQARLALSILTFWSSAERRTHLMGVLAFPEVWFENMTLRVLSAAVSFGLSMEPHMRQQALDQGLAADPEALVRLSLANFAEVNLGLKANDLELLDIWNNWEALLACSEELDVQVDEEIEELAALSMQKARAATQMEDEDDFDVDESVEVQEIDLSSMTATDLVGHLEEPKNRLEACLALIRRGEQAYVPALFDAMLKMSREELLQAVPAALALGPAFEASFLTGLKSRRGNVRLASVLFLAEIRSERAAPDLLALLSAVDEPQWPVVARAAARVGRRILEPALAVVRRAGDPGGRIAHALALLGPEARGALAAAQDQAETPAIAACLERALDQAGRVSFGDAADFGERLADALVTLGPDGVGPDYEEDMASIDLSGASVDALEIDTAGRGR